MKLPRTRVDVGTSNGRVTGVAGSAAGSRYPSVSGVHHDELRRRRLQKPGGVAVERDGVDAEGEPLVDRARAVK